VADERDQRAVVDNMALGIFSDRRPLLAIVGARTIDRAPVSA
jgi:hypothetical protein